MLPNTNPSWRSGKIITDKISHFIAETVAKDIPQDAAELARLGITDFTGVALVGSKEEQSKIIVNYAQKMGGVPQASIIGAGFKTSPYLAALVNGTVGHSLDYDDMAISLIGHPSVFLVPAILAIGESIGSSGQDMLTAYVVGYEITCHIARPILQSHYIQGWHSTATFGTLGAAASAAWLLKLNAHQVSEALGIAASLAGGLRQNFGTMTKPLHAGKAAASGIQAALLAQAGFTADTSIIEAPMGFAKVFGHDEEVNWAEVIEKLGKTFLITSAEGLSIKPYPSCGFTHCAIDATLYIKEEHKFNATDIAEVELGVTPFDKQILIHHNPKTGLEGKFSLEYCVALALLSGEVRLKHLTDEAVAETQVKGLMKKMKWVEKYPMPVMGTPEGFGSKSITVKLKDGRQYCKEVTIAKGMPQNPLTPNEFNSKYRDCASNVLSEGDVEKTLFILTNLEKMNLPEVRELIEIISNKF
ncbi:MmgE/PrpD family protein [Chloroflexota bacterium]